MEGIRESASSAAHGHPVFRLAFVNPATRAERFIDVLDALR
ncbi:MAG: hypothetical protein ABJA81_13515 [Nocardioidaceae bacterium]